MILSFNHILFQWWFSIGRYLFLLFLMFCYNLLFLLGLGINISVVRTVLSFIFETLSSIFFSLKIWKINEWLLFHWNLLLTGIAFRLISCLFCCLDYATKQEIRHPTAGWIEEFFSLFRLFLRISITYWHFFPLLL